MNRLLLPVESVARAQALCVKLMANQDVKYFFFTGNQSPDTRFLIHNYEKELSTFEYEIMKTNQPGSIEYCIFVKSLEKFTLNFFESEKKGPTQLDFFLLE